MKEKCAIYARNLAHWDCGQNVGRAGVREGVRMYSREDREWALYVLSETRSLREAARITGISHVTIARWRDAAGGPPAPRKRKSPVYLSHERKMELVTRLEAGERAADLAAETGITASAVTNWHRRFREEGVIALMSGNELRAASPAPAEPPSGEEALRRRCKELELENAVLRGTVEILKKDPGADPSALTAAERAALADTLRGEFPLADVLSVLSLPRSTYHYHRARRGYDRHAWLRPLVREAFASGRGAYGYRRVHAALSAGGVRVSEKVVRRVMREEGLAAALPRRRRAYSSYAGEAGLRSAPNLLLEDGTRDRHDFSAAHPNEKWVTDITEFALPCGDKVYLSPVVDLFDGAVISFAAGTSPSKALVGGMLAEAAAHLREGEAPVLHSDRGWHYRTPDWVASCKDAGIIRSMSRKGHSPDNAAMEGWFGRLKVEFFHGADWSGWTADGFCEALSEHIKWSMSGRLKAFDEGGRMVYDTVEGRRRRLGLAA